MKILHIHPSMSGGGIEAMIAGLSNIMVKNEEVSVCSIFTPNEEDIFWNNLDPAVHKFTLNKTRPGFSLVEIFKIFRLLRKEKFDVVNIHGFLYYYIVAIILLHKKIRFFYTVHSDAEKENSKWDKRLLFFKKYFFKVGWIHPITISHISQQSFEKFYGQQSHMIYNGVQSPNISNNNDILEQYRYTSKTKIFIHAGRIDIPKNQLVLCRVFNQLIENGEDVVLLIAGAKQDLQIYNQIECYFSERIQYLGERRDIPYLMLHSDAMCLASIWEGLPITLLEALSVGCVPICTPVGGIAEVINDGWNGILSEGTSECCYFNAVKRFLSMSEQMYSDMKSNTILSFEKFDIHHSAREYINYYRHFL